MKIHYTLDDSPARLPLSIRSAEGVWDRAADLRSSPGAQLVEMATQYLLNTGITLVDELAIYFETDMPSESDPYAIAHCYAHHTELEDLLRDVREASQPGLVALHEVAELFPLDFDHDLQFMLALTVVGYPAFGYVRTYNDSEGEAYHGMVLNIAQARPHLESLMGQYSLDLLIRTARHGFFNHEGFLLAYSDYTMLTDRVPDKLLDRLKDALMSRGIAWYLSYRHDLAFYDQMQDVNDAQLGEYIEGCNALLAAARKKKTTDEAFEDWLNLRQSDEQRLNLAGYFAARAIAETHGDDGLREAIFQGPDRFIDLYNTTGKPRIRAGR